jgi:PLP dependent protein
MPTKSAADRLDGLLQRISAASPRGKPATLVAVGKTRPPEDLRALAQTGQRVFGENYVQEALAKRCELADLDLEWHLIGRLQSNKSREAATCFDWVQTIDREKPLALLDRFRPADRGPLNLLIQVNIDDETTKSGCRPEQVLDLAAAVARFPRLRLRGLMAIPAPQQLPERRQASFAAMRSLFDQVQREHPGIDTLSMGMSDDFEQAIAEGATMVRVGSALFGERSPE